LSLEGKAEKLMLEIVCGGYTFRTLTFEDKYFWVEGIRVYISEETSMKVNAVR
jgi:hypothetical protein